MSQSFTVTLVGRGPKSAWTFMPVPFEVESVFGVKGRVAVSGTMNGFPFQNSLLPQGDGTHAMAVNKDLQAGANARAGDTVHIVLERDTAKRDVALPVELEDALGRDATASAAFAEMAPSCRKEYADWIGSAKKPETRASRVVKALALIREKRRLS
jgi:hypothetical protein